MYLKCIKKKMRKEKTSRMQCPNCKAIVQETDNFCKHCGKKIKKHCNCWVKKKDNYDCGESSCPGYKLFKVEKLKAK